MLVSCKRPVSFEELLEPLQKRCRPDAVMCDDPYAGHPGHAAWGQEPAYGSALGPACSSGRRHAMEDGIEPPDKRLRLGPGPVPLAGSGASAPCSGERDRDGERDERNAERDGERDGEREAREASIRGWTEAIIRALHGCPSVEEAAQRCARALLEFEAEVRQAALREEERREDERPDSPQGLQHTNRVLMRAVHHLAERCRRLEAGAAEVAQVQQALEQSQEAQRRLAHSNEVLQGHLKLHLDSCRGHPFP